MRDEMMIHVSRNGNDEAEGTNEHPFHTIVRARQEARKLAKRKVPVRIQVHAGTYYLSEPLRFGPEDSGTENADVIYESYAGEGQMEPRQD